MMPFDRKRHREMLKDYYKVSESEIEDFDPYNINGSDFNPDLFLNKLLKELTLTELMEKETDIYRQIQCLDSEMQTLVYENYNKFISATDTIRKMKHDFKKMEEEMDLLATNMTAITDFSGKISTTLQGRREIISKLSGTHSLLKKLQFLFELPPRLKSCIENEAYGQAVRYYIRAEQVLVQYENMPSFQGIQEDCDNIVGELKNKLRSQFHSKEASAKQLAECVDLLLQLNEPADKLCDEFLTHACSKLQVDLDELGRQNILLAGGEGNQIQVNETTERASEKYINSVPMDILEFIDYGCNNFLSNLSLVIASYFDMFLNRNTVYSDESKCMEDVATRKLNDFATKLMSIYFETVNTRIKLEKDNSDNFIIVRAVDRFHRRLQALAKLLPTVDFSKQGMEIVCNAATERSKIALIKLGNFFNDSLTDVRQSLASGSTNLPLSSSSSLANLLNTLEDSICEQIRRTLNSLKAFIQQDITFAAKTYFLEAFCQKNVQEGVVVALLKYINSVILELVNNCNEKTSTPSGGLVLLLSRFCLDMETSTVTYLLSLVHEQFSTEIDAGQLSLLCEEFKESAQALLDCYVRIQGLTISQMLRKSVDTRDWMSTLEPRNVRAVMKRVVEDMTALDTQVGQLFEEGIRRERSSDSSRRTFPYSSSRQQAARSNWSAYAPSVDNSLISNIQKLFSERIEIFSKVEFSKVSVMTGIIKISLKTFLECVRLRTFSRNGLQQVQVDTHYLQLYLWRFVIDENLVHVLLDEVVGSTIHRCIDPVMMEASVIEVICGRG